MAGFAVAVAALAGFAAHGNAQIETAAQVPVSHRMAAPAAAAPSYAGPSDDEKIDLAMGMLRPVERYAAAFMPWRIERGHSGPQPFDQEPLQALQDLSAQAAP